MRRYNAVTVSHVAFPATYGYVATLRYEHPTSR
jgi:hypothetical protein